MLGEGISWLALGVAPTIRPNFVSGVKSPKPTWVACEELGLNNRD